MKAAGAILVLHFELGRFVDEARTFRQAELTTNLLFMRSSFTANVHLPSTSPKISSAFTIHTCSLLVVDGRTWWGRALLLWSDSLAVASQLRAENDRPTARIDQKEERMERRRRRTRNKRNENGRPSHPAAAASDSQYRNHIYLRRRSHVV